MDKGHALIKVGCCAKDSHLRYTGQCPKINILSLPFQLLMDFVFKSEGIRNCSLGTPQSLKFNLYEHDVIGIARLRLTNCRQRDIPASICVTTSQRIIDNLNKFSEWLHFGQNCMN